MKFVSRIYQTTSCIRESYLSQIWNHRSKYKLGYLWNPLFNISDELVLFDKKKLKLHSLVYLNININIKTL